MSSGDKNVRKNQERTNIGGELNCGNKIREAEEEVINIRSSNTATDTGTGTDTGIHTSMDTSEDLDFDYDRDLMTSSSSASSRIGMISSTSRSEMLSNDVDHPIVSYGSQGQHSLNYSQSADGTTATNNSTEYTNPIVPASAAADYKNMATSPTTTTYTHNSMSEAPVVHFDDSVRMIHRNDTMMSDVLSDASPFPSRFAFRPSLGTTGMNAVMNSNSNHTHNNSNSNSNSKHTENMTRENNDYDSNNNNNNNNNSQNHVLIVLLRSGRFASALFSGVTCLRHTTSTRYTTRRGQGGAQSTSDSSHVAKSIGSQLRRAGEASLKDDVRSAFISWAEAGILKPHHLACMWVGGAGGSTGKILGGWFWDHCWRDVLSISKKVKSSQGVSNRESDDSYHIRQQKQQQQLLPLMDGKDERVRNVPIDFGRPSFEACIALHQSLMEVKFHTIPSHLFRSKQNGSEEGCDAQPKNKHEEKDRTKSRKESNAISHTKSESYSNIIPLTPFHIAAQDANIKQLNSLVASMTLQEHAEDEQQNNNENDESNLLLHGMMNSRAGPTAGTPLHLAASSTSINASEFVHILLTKYSANPTILDNHSRPPYYLCTSDAVRKAFRMARSDLGEDCFDWDTDAKVGPPLTTDDVKEKREKAAEKKRRQRARQKERKAEQQRAQEEALRKLKEEESRKAQEEDARRKRAGLSSNNGSKPMGDNVCDFCSKVCPGKRRKQMFHRLNFVYCSMDCVKKHQRELTASAAAARFR